MKWLTNKIRSFVQFVWTKLGPKARQSKPERMARIALVGGIFGGVLLAIFVFFYALFLLIFVLPNPNDLRKLNLTESTLIMDREGKLLYAIHGEENREALDDLNDISHWVVEATIAIEDDKFYKHIGIDVPALFKAVLSEVGIGRPRGGSTITQQFVKNTFLTSEHSYSRKFKEILLSLTAELRFSKDEILLMYLNAIPYGSNAYGIELAANTYFGKDAKDLTLAESAILAAIPQAPTRYSPYGNFRYSTIHFELNEETLGKRKIRGEQDLNYEEWTRGLIGKTYTLPDGNDFYLKGRSDLVLDRMLELELIDDAEYKDARAAVQTTEFTPYRETIKAPHFVLWVKQLLEDKYGAAVVEQGGLKVYTTLDPDFQAAAEKSIEERKESLNSLGAQNAALISVQPQTGQILAMVGSADYFDNEIDGQVNIITSARHPGSSFKPFIYALAFLNQYSPATVLYDVETNFGNYTPKNYSGTFVGPISIREALGRSLNIPAIKAYFLAGQEEDVLPYLRTLGFETFDSAGGYGPPLALGAIDVTPMEMAAAYSVFANGGTKVPLTPFLKITNADGQVLEQWEEAKMDKEEVMDPEVAFLINDVLSDRSVGLGPNLYIESLDNATKTGTSNKRLPNNTILPNNLWTAAYTPNNVTITWVGNSDGSPMAYNADGYSTSAVIWKGFMNQLLERVEATPWVRPAGIKDIAISKATGKLPGEDTPSDMIRTEVFASFAVPTERDDSYQKVRVETITNRLATPYSPEKYVEEKTYRVHRSILGERFPSWQAAIDAWAANQGDNQPPRESAEDIHNAETAANVPEITITDPLSLSEISSEEKTVDIDVEILDAGNGLQKVEFSMNGILQDTATNAPYNGTIRLPFHVVEGDIIEVEATVVDIFGYNNTSKIQLRIGDSQNRRNNNNDEDSNSGLLPEVIPGLRRSLRS